MGCGGGQSVLARDQHDPAGPLTACRISRTYRRTAHSLQVLTLRDELGHEQTLRVTEEHPFHLASGGEAWVPAKSLAAGDTILGGDGTLSVVSNEPEAHPAGVTVYNLEVEDAHTYFVLAADAPADAEAVWVHNATNYLKADPSEVVNELGGFRSKVFKINGQNVLLDRSGMTHILERHHPKFWNGTVKAAQSFFAKRTTVPQIKEMISVVLKQNRARVKAIGANGIGQLEGIVGGSRYRLGLNRGRVGQFYPVTG